MKKLINQPTHYVGEMHAGLLLANPSLKLGGGSKRVIRRDNGARSGKVGIASGGAGVRCFYGNYGGDRMNFDMASELLAGEGIGTRTVLGTDDIASAAPNEGYGSSNNHAPLPIALPNDQTPAVLTLPIWEPAKAGVTARLRLVLFQHVESDEVTVQINGAALKQDLADAQWKDPRIFSSDSQPATVTPGALVKNPATQKLTRLEFLVPTDILKRGENQIAIAVNRKGPFPPSTFVKVEKVEMHLK